MTIFLIFVVLYIIYRMIYINQNFFKPQKVRAAMYEFFAVRDSLIGLVIDGTINEDDNMYQMYYNNVNLVLKYFKKLKNITIADLIKLEKELTKDDIIKVREIIRQTNNHTSEELKKIVRQYHEGIITLICHNTTFATVLKIGTIPLVKHWGSKFAQKALALLLGDSYAFYQEHKQALAVT